MPPQALEDLEPALDRRPQVLGAANLVGVIEVVGPHADPEQLPAQPPLDLHRVVDSAQQHRLVVDGHAGPQELAHRPLGLRRDLVRMIEVGVEPDRPVAIAQPAELRVDPLRQDHGKPGTEPDDLEMRDRAQPGQEIAEATIVQRQRVPAGDDDVADRRRGAQVLDGGLDLGRPADPVAQLPLALARAVPAQQRTDVGDDQQRAIGIAMHEPRHRRVGRLLQRIVLADLRQRGLARVRHRLPQDRVVGIVVANERQVVRRDRQRELRGHGGEPGDGVGRDRHDARQRLGRGDAMAEVPLPVRPFRRRRPQQVEDALADRFAHRRYAVGPGR